MAARVLPDAIAGRPPTLPRGRRRDQVVLTGTTRRALWVLVITLELFNAVLLGAWAKVYFSRDQRGSMLSVFGLYFLYADEYEFLSQYSMVVAVSYALLSLVFASGSLHLIWQSIRRRRLQFGGGMPASSTVLRKPAPTVGDLKLASPNPPPTVVTPPPSCWQSIRQFANRLRMAVGVRGQYFDLRMVVDECFELTSQTFAAYSSSRSISNVYLNQTYGVVIFLNSTSTLVFHRIFQKSQVRQRVACLLTDLVLDFVWGTLLPMWMYVPVRQLYTETITDEIADGENSSRLINRVLVVSWSNFALTVIPFLNSLFNLWEIQSVLCEICMSSSSSKESRRPTVILSLHPPFPACLLPPPAAAAATGSRPRPWGFASKMVHVLIALYGCTVLFISLSTHEFISRIERQTQYECISRVHPWFGSKEACIARRVNCTAAGIHGGATDLEAALDLFDEDSLTDLYFTSCEALEIPRGLTRFYSLLTLTIEHSWITDWPASAAVVAPAFVGLKTIKLIDVDTNSTLDGLVSAPVSPLIEYIRFDSVASAPRILDAVGTNWQHLIYLDCDDCNLSEFPAVVTTMHQLLTLSLAGNRIHEVPELWITHWDLHLIGLWMDRNVELTTLPDVVWQQAASCDMFSMQATNLSEVPEWLPSVAQSEFVVYAHGSPLCDDNASLLSETQLISCVLREE